MTYCENCEKQLEDGVRYCNKCGGITHWWIGDSVEKIKTVNKPALSEEQNLQKGDSIAFCQDCGKKLEYKGQLCDECKVARIQQMNPPIPQKAEIIPRKTLVLAGVILGLLIIAAITNPREERHRQAVRSNLSRNYDINDMGWLVFRENIRIGVQVDDYIFLSFTRLTVNNSWAGIGAFGNVWIFGDLKFVESQHRLRLF